MGGREGRREGGKQRGRKRDTIQEKHSPSLLGAMPKPVHTEPMLWSGGARV
jgi:hypothetical protein